VTKPNKTLQQSVALSAYPWVSQTRAERFCCWTRC